MGRSFTVAVAEWATVFTAPGRPERLADDGDVFFF
jgi:hypothetical protein